MSCDDLLYEGSSIESSHIWETFKEVFIANKYDFSKILADNLAKCKARKKENLTPFHKQTNTLYLRSIQKKGKTHLSNNTAEINIVTPISSSMAKTLMDINKCNKRSKSLSRNAERIKGLTNNFTNAKVRELVEESHERCEQLLITKSHFLRMRVPIVNRSKILI